MVDPLRTFMGSTTKKVPISDYAFYPLFLSSQQVLFLCKGRVNFLYAKVVFHYIRANLSRVTFQYRNFMEC